MDVIGYSPTHRKPIPLKVHALLAGLCWVIALITSVGSITTIRHFQKTSGQTVLSATPDGPLAQRIENTLTWVGFLGIGICASASIVVACFDRRDTAILAAVFSALNSLAACAAMVVAVAPYSFDAFP